MDIYRPHRMGLVRMMKKPRVNLNYNVSCNQKMYYNKFISMHNMHVQILTLALTDRLLMLYTLLSICGLQYNTTLLFIYLFIYFLFIYLFIY